MTHGYIYWSFTRSHLDSPTNRCFGKPPFVNSGSFLSRALTSRRSPPHVGRDSSQTCSRREGSLGKAKSGNKNNRTQKKGWNHRCWAKKAFPVDESSLGGKTESWVEKIKQPV